MMLCEIIPACVFALVAANAAVLRHSNSSDKRANYHRTAALIHHKAKSAETSFTEIHHHTIFQCWNKPASRITYEIGIRHRRDYTTISSIPIAAVSEIDGKTEAFVDNLGMGMLQVAKTRETNLKPTETTVRRIRSRSWSQVNSGSSTNNTSREIRQSLQSLQGNETSVVKEDLYLLPRQVIPVHYDIRLIPHIVEGNFTSNGETSIDVKVLEPTDVVMLHAVQLTIDESETRMTRGFSDDAKHAAPHYVPKRHDYNKKSEMLTLHFDEPLYIGAYTLHLKFVGVIASSERGLYRSFYVDNNGNKVWLVVTHFQPVRARQAFPCWDEPAMKATFKFSIKHYPNYTALSNMPSSRSEVDEADGKVWTRFETTPVMTTNVLGFVVADYDHISNLNDSMRIWGPKHLLHLAARPLDIAEKATRELEIFTNSTVSVPKMDHVVAPHYSSRATENWGMIVYRMDTLLYDDNIPSEIEILTDMSMIDLKLYDAMTITHELAHQWFGNLVSPTWWNYLWLSEGISTYLKFFITDKFLKEWRLMDFFVVENMHTMFDIDDRKSAKPIHINITSNVYEAYSGMTYTKSAILLQMMSHFLTEDVFRNGLVKYLRVNAYSNATPDDLWKALQNALDESDVPHNDFSVKEVMDTWFEQANYPVVTIDRDYTNGEIRATQKLVRHKVDDIENNATWWVPLNFATQTDLDFSSTLATHWLRPRDNAITIEGVDVDDWVIVNKQLTGYYRVNYDTTNWKRIAAFLNSDDYTKIPVLNRAQIISDAAFMLKNDQLDFVTFLEIMNYLSRETDRVVWQPAFKVLRDFYIYLRIPEAAAIFKPFVFNLTHKILEDVGFDDHPDDDPFTIKTRASLGDLACTYGHAECQAKATAKLLAYVEDPIANKILRDQRWVFCFGLMKASDAVWNKFLQAQNLTLEHHLKFLGCTENMNIVENHINYTRTMENKLSHKYIYHMYISRNVFKNPSNTDRAIDYFINNSNRLNKFNDFMRVVNNQMALESVREDHFTKIRLYSEQRRIVLRILVDKEKVVAKVRNNLAKIHSALENNQFSVPMHITLNNSTS